MHSLTHPHLFPHVGAGLRRQRPDLRRGRPGRPDEPVGDELPSVERIDGDHRAGQRRRGRRAAAGAHWVEAQARAVLEDMPVAAFKVGLPGNARDHCRHCPYRGRLSADSAGLDHGAGFGRGDDLSTRR